MHGAHNHQFPRRRVHSPRSVVIREYNPMALKLWVETIAFGRFLIEPFEPNPLTSSKYRPRLRPLACA